MQTVTTLLILHFQNTIEGKLGFNTKLEFSNGDSQNIIAVPVLGLGVVVVVVVVVVETVELVVALIFSRQ